MGLDANFHGDILSCHAIFVNNPMYDNNGHDRKCEPREELTVHFVDRAVLCVDDQFAIVDLDALVCLAVALAAIMV